MAVVVRASRYLERRYSNAVRGQDAVTLLARVAGSHGERREDTDEAQEKH